MQGLTSPHPVPHRADVGCTYRNAMPKNAPAAANVRTNCTGIFVPSSFPPPSLSLSLDPRAELLTKPTSEGLSAQFMQRSTAAIRDTGELTPTRILGRSAAPLSLVRRASYESQSPQNNAGRRAGGATTTRWEKDHVNGGHYTTMPPESSKSACLLPGQHLLSELTPLSYFRLVP